MLGIEYWVWWTLFAASMQAIRTAGQKHLSNEVTPLATTLVRYLFGLPFAIIWFCLLVQYADVDLPPLNRVFFLSGLTAGLLQIIATVLLIRLFTLRNFAIGTTYAKSELLLTATIGIVLFSEQVTWFAGLAIVICVAGLVIITLARANGIKALWSQSAIYGLGSGLCFALTSLFLRQASLSLEMGERTDITNTLTASMTLLYMVALQTVVTTVLVIKTQPGEFNRVFKAWRPALFVGFTGVLGSIGWFTAMTLEMASYVKTLGQVEFIMTLGIAVFYFREKPSKKELLGMAMIFAGGMMLLVPGT